MKPEKCPHCGAFVKPLYENDDVLRGTFLLLECKRCQRRTVKEMYS